MDIYVNHDKVISDAVIKRLPRYYRALKDLEMEGVSKVNSTVIADMLRITASQVRQDFYTVGGHGIQGYGYEVSTLLGDIAAILGLDKRYDMIIIGAGRIGLALSAYKGFRHEGFVCKAVFDVVTEGKHVGDGQQLLHIDCLEEYLSHNHTDIAVIATQKEETHAILDRLVASGIKAIWNFAPIDLATDDKSVVIENINMSESLFVLAFKMNNKLNG